MASLRMLALVFLGATLLGPVQPALANCTAEAAASALLDKYVAAVNARDTASFGDIHAESYIQHSGRSPNGLAAQVENFRTIFARMPDVEARVEDRIIQCDKIVARMTFSATHTQPMQGLAPTGPALHLAHHRHLARRERKACRALGRGRLCGDAKQLRGE